MVGNKDRRSRRDKTITNISLLLVLGFVLCIAWYVCFIWQPTYKETYHAPIVQNYEIGKAIEEPKEQTTGFICCGFKSAWVNRVWDKEAKCIKWCEI